MMEKLDILMFAMGGGFAGTWMLIFYGLSRMGKLDDKLTDIDRRGCRIEGALTNKECCILSSSSKEKAQ